MDRFEELRTLVAIVETGGVNAAAASLGIARSAASRRLADLEARLGVILVDRGNRRQFALTERGRAFYRNSRRILDDLAAVEASLTGSGAAEGRATAVWAEPTLATHLLAGPIASFVADEPNALVTFVEGEADRADVVVSTQAVPRGRTLMSYSRLIVAAPSYLERRGEPASPADLCDHAGIAVASSGEADWRFTSGTTTRPVITLEASHQETGLAAAIAGAGLVQLPSYVCRQAIEDGRLKAVLTRHDVEGGRIFVARNDTDGVMADLLVEHLTRSLGSARRR